LTKKTTPTGERDGATKEKTFSQDGSEDARNEGQHFPGAVEVVGNALPFANFSWIRTPPPPRTSSPVSAVMGFSEGGGRWVMAKSRAMVKYRIDGIIVAILTLGTIVLVGIRG
jgi:hypothetical protein